MENNSDIVIDGSTATWTLPLTHGDYLGSYSGTFKFRCWLSPTQELEAGRLYRELLGPSAMLINEHEGQVGYCLSQLKMRVLESPPFWSTYRSESGLNGDIPDLNVLLLILDGALRSEKLYKEKILKERETKLKNTIELAEQRLREDKEEG